MSPYFSSFSTKKPRDLTYLYEEKMYRLTNLKFVNINSFSKTYLSTSIKLLNQSKSFYTILGVPESATDKEIKKAFRNKSLQCHPDKFPGDSRKEAEFKTLSEAYQTLSDKSLRSKYDLDRKSPGSRTGGGPQGGPGNRTYQNYANSSNSNSHSHSGGYSFHYRSAQEARQAQSKEEFFRNRRGNAQERFNKSRTYTKTENDIFGRRQSYYKHQRPEENEKYGSRWNDDERMRHHFNFDNSWYRDGKYDPTSNMTGGYGNFRRDNPSGFWGA